MAFPKRKKTSKKILLKCPKCRHRLTTGMAVLGKLGECKKCGASFRAPTEGLIKRRRIIQIICGILLFILLGVLPGLYIRSVMDANKRTEIAKRELEKLEGSIRLQELLDKEGLGSIQSQLVKLDPPEDQTNLISRIETINSKLMSGGVQVAKTKEQLEAEAAAKALEDLPAVDWDPSKDGMAGNNQGRDEFLARRAAQDAARAAALAAQQGRTIEAPPEKEKDPKAAAEAASLSGMTNDGSADEPANDKTSNEEEPEQEQLYTSSDPSVSGDAYDFLVDGLGSIGDEQTFSFLTGQGYVDFVLGYAKTSRKEYDSVGELSTFREKGEFETTAAYEKAKKVWEDELRDPLEIVREKLLEMQPPQTFVVDDLKVVDGEQGYDADNQVWRQLRFVFTGDKSLKISNFAMAVNDETVTGGTDVHRGEKEVGDSGHVWKVLSQDEILNLPIEIEKAKTLRAKLNEDEVRVGLVIQFPGEARFSKPPSSAELLDPELDRSKIDRRFPVILRKIAIYDSDSGEIFFDRVLGKPSWERVELPPSDENLSKLGF